MPLRDSVRRRPTRAWRVGPVLLSLTAWGSCLPAAALDSSGGVGGEVAGLAIAQGAGLGALPRSAEEVPGAALAYPDGATPVSSLRAWATATDTWARIGPDFPRSAVRSSTRAFTVGVDGPLDPTLRAGLLAGYSQGETSSFGVRNELNTIAPGVYVIWTPANGFELEGLVGLNRTEIATLRTLTDGALTRPTGGETSASGVSASSSAGYRWKFGTSIGEAFVKPLAGFTYTSQTRRGYLEEGPLGPGLLFPTRTFERAITSVGLITGVDFRLSDAVTVRPELRAAWSRDLVDPSPAVPAFRFGAPTILRDPEPGRDAAVIGVDLTAWRSSAAQVFAGYAGEFRRNATAHQGRLGLRLVW